MKIEKKTKKSINYQPSEKEVKEKRPFPIIEAGEILARIQKDRPSPLKILKKALPILAAVICLIILVFIFRKTVSLIRKPKWSPPTSLVQPTPSPGIASPSAYASDSAVLKIEKDLLEIEEILKKTKFRESTLLLPEIDMNVKFKEEN